MKQFSLRLMTLGLVLGGVNFFQSIAHAIPPAQAVCAFTTVSISAANGAVAMPGLTLTVTNLRTVTQKAIVQVSADIGVEIDAEVRISYALDSGPPLEDTFGPANLANQAQYYEGRMVIAVIPVPPGKHTIRPFWRVSGAPAKTAVMDSRCATIEVLTR